MFLISCRVPSRLGAACWLAACALPVCLVSGLAQHLRATAAGSFKAKEDPRGSIQPKPLADHRLTACSIVELLRKSEDTYYEASKLWG